MYMKTFFNDDLKRIEKKEYMNLIMKLMEIMEV